MSQPNNFWQRHPGLVWSNPAAEDSTHIRAALLQPRFSQLLDIAREFGLPQLRREWELLKLEGTVEARRAQGPVERILEKIERGLALASPRD
jgi:hypothetical protein